MNNPTWKWYLKYGVMNLVMVVLLFSTLFFLMYYMQGESGSHLVNSDPGLFDITGYGPVGVGR